MPKSDIVRIRHMLDAAREAMSFAQGRSREDLDNDRMFVLALIKAIEILGEAAYQTSDETRERWPEIPWDDIIGMRHRLVHAYFDINLNVLWMTVKYDLPLRVAKLESIPDQTTGV